TIESVAKTKVVTDTVLFEPGVSWEPATGADSPPKKKEASTQLPMPVEDTAQQEEPAKEQTIEAGHDTLPQEPAFKEEPQQTIEPADEIILKEPADYKPAARPEQAAEPAAPAARPAVAPARHTVKE